MVNSLLKTWILQRMYGSSTFLPPTNFAVFDDWYFHLKHVLLYKPSILLANIQLFPQPWFYKKKERKKKHTIWSVWQTIVMKLHNLVNGTGYLSELKKKKICMYEIPKPHANFITLTLGAEATYLERSKGFCSHLALFSLSQKKVASLLFLVSSVVFPSRPYFFSFFAFSS